MRNQHRTLQIKRKVITLFFIIIFTTQIAATANQSSFAHANTQTESFQLSPTADSVTAGTFIKASQAAFITTQVGSASSYSVAVNVVGSGVVNINPNETEYAAGSNITITAAPEDGWSFASWSGDLTGTTNPASLIVEENITIIANFVQNVLASTYAMVFTEHGLPLGTLWGVTVKPQGIFFVLSHGETVSSESSTVTLHVPPGNYAWNASALIYVGTGTRYLALGSSGSGTADVLSPVSQNISYGTQFAVSLVVNPANGGSTSHSNLTVWEDSGKSLAISAVPNSGYTFSSWTTNNSLITLNDPSSASTVATINGAGTVVADFLSLSSPTTAPTPTSAPSPTPTPTSTPNATPSQTPTPTHVATQTPAPSLTPAPVSSGLPIVVLVAILAAGIILAAVAAVLLARKRRG